MEIITVNAGQGSLSIVRHNGEAVIMDSRIPPAGDETVTYAKGVLAKYLKNYYVKGLILTGFDDDHSDAVGVSIVLNKYRPDWIMYPKYYKDTGEADDVFDVLKQYEKDCKQIDKEFKRISVSLDRNYFYDLGYLTNNFEMKLFSPHPDDMNSSNNASIVLRLRGVGSNGFSYLITGDTECSRWERINKVFGKTIKSDVMAAPHHGSINACSAKTLLLVQPDTVLISAGVDNQYGHPDQNALAAYASVAKVYSTNIPFGSSLFTNQINGNITTIRFE